MPSHSSDTQSRVARALSVVGVALLVLGATGAVLASPAPVPVCGPCEQPFESAADVHGVDVSIEHSEARMRVHRDGSATWTVHNRLAGPGLDRLRGNASLVDAVAAESLSYPGTGAWDPVLVNASLAGNGTLTVHYRMPDVATRTNGVLRVEYFRDDPGGYVYTDLGADRLTVVGPPGTRVSQALPGSTVDGRQLTLSTFDGNGDSFVVFAPRGDALSGVDTALAVWSVLLPVVAENLAFVVVVPGLVSTALLFGATRGLDRAVPSPSPALARRVGRVVAGLGALLALHPIVFRYEPALLAGGVAAVVFGAVAATRPSRLTLRTQVGVGVVGLTLGALAAVVGTVLFSRAMDLSVLATGVLAAATVLLAVPVGYAVRHGSDRARRAVYAFPLLALVVGAVLAFPLTVRQRTVGLVAAILVLVAVLVVLLGAPLFALGMALPDGESRTAGGAATDSRSAGDQEGAGN